MANDATIGERRGREAELLSARGFVSLAELTGSLAISESTARRDLEALEELGIVRRTHGGAVYVKDSPAHQLGFNERQTTAAVEKQAIAAAVAARVPAGGALILDGGTTTWHVAAALAGRRLSVITNSVPIASLLSGEVNTEVTLIGGYLYPRTGVALGSMAETQLAGLHASQLVLSCAGLCEEGAFNANQMMVDLERRMMASADEVILAVDHTKLGRRAVVKLCDLADVDLIVTDAGANDEQRRWLATCGAEVIFAETQHG
ncbi:MAG: putative HTH-type transcriptional regulator YdjF [Phycisphaerae bacterium]|nr:putative HTH-type transcriptional regulator YdjF [Phycisphaerae bacterium]